MQNERFQLQNVANGIQSGRFQLPNAASSMENRHGQELKKTPKQKKHLNNFLPIIWYACLFFLLLVVFARILQVLYWFSVIGEVPCEVVGTDQKYVQNNCEYI
jgi:hypothetical protein